MSDNGSELEGGYWGYADMDGRVASPISAYAAGFVDSLSGPAAQPRAFRIGSCSELEAEGTEFYTGTERLIATKEEPSSRPLQPIRKDLVIRFRRQRLAREAIMAAKEISVKKYVVRLSGEERER